MRFSKLYAPTTKEAPKDATLPSHQYLVRGGFISQVGSGLYNFLPMGKIVFDKIKNVALVCRSRQAQLLNPLTPQLSYTVL